MEILMELDNLSTQVQSAESHDLIHLRFHAVLPYECEYEVRCLNREPHLTRVLVNTITRAMHGDLQARNRNGNNRRAVFVEHTTQENPSTTGGRSEANQNSASVRTSCRSKTSLPAVTPATLSQSTHAPVPAAAAASPRSHVPASTGASRRTTIENDICHKWHKPGHFTADCPSRV